MAFTQPAHILTEISLVFLPPLPVPLVVVELPQLIIDVAGLEVVRVDEVAPVQAVAHVEEGVPLAQVGAQGHVGVKKAVDEVGAVGKIVS